MKSEEQPIRTVTMSQPRVRKGKVQLLLLCALDFYGILVFGYRQCFDRRMVFYCVFFFH